MNTGGESAELLMKMMLNGSEVLIRLTGSGAKNVAVLLYSVLREQNKTKGSERLSNMLLDEFRAAKIGRITLD